MNSETIDVSIVLNLHREALYLKTTLRSLNECIVKASDAGIGIELVAVFDRADETTRCVFDLHIFPPIKAVKTVHIDVGSLGLARNAGVEAAVGEYVWTADGDDLVSDNAIIELLHTARSQPNSNHAVFLEYLVAFGNQFHVVRYVDSYWLTAADFAFQHPFVSRIFIKREALLLNPYLDLKLDSGFAYEDWDLNNRLFAQGFEFKIATGTVIFYRQRSNSLLQQANAMSAKLTPQSSLFGREKFLELMESKFQQVTNWEEFIESRRKQNLRNCTEDFFSCPKRVRNVVEAAQIDPEVSPPDIETAGSYSPIPWEGSHWGFRLVDLYHLLGREIFSDILILPWLKPGGAEKYILQLLDRLQSNGLCKKLLVISSHPAQVHEWVDRLPTSSVFIDLYNFFPEMSQKDMLMMAVRSILTVSNRSTRLHIKACGFGHDMLDVFGGALSKALSIIYYRFSDDFIFWRGTKLPSSWEIQFFRRQLPNIYKIITDCQRIANSDHERFGIEYNKYSVIYTRSGDIVSKPLHTLTKPTGRLLWASRICDTKRPELALSISKELQIASPEIRIEMYGSLENPYHLEMFSDSPNLVYCGEFNNFSEICVADYDALIYTSSRDGMPNIILEAMASGLPVIAPDIGGIAETIKTGNTGWLVPDLDDENALINEYMEAIRHLYSDWKNTQSVIENSLNLVNQRHSTEAFNRRVNEVFV